MINIRITKTDHFMEGSHPNGVNIGMVWTGCSNKKPELEQCFNFVLHFEGIPTNRVFSTTKVKSIEGNIIRTTNSEYTIEYLDDNWEPFKKLFTYFKKGEYTGGLAVIAASNRNDADEFASYLNDEAGVWEFSSLLLEEYSGEVGVIDYNYYNA